MMRRKTHSSGFTLIELLAVLGVIVLVSTIIFANNSRFGGSVILENLAHEVALSIRQAQTYGVSVLRSGSGSQSKFSEAHGVHFDARTVNSRRSYVIYADRNGNGLYNSGNSELIQSFAFASGYGISALYTDDCSTATTQILDITFRRPEPEAYINGSGGRGQLERVACIELVSPKGVKAHVRVYATGQIDVK